jgi:hypothetical protein
MQIRPERLNFLNVLFKGAKLPSSNVPACLGMLAVHKCASFLSLFLFPMLLTMLECADKTEGGGQANH